MHISLSCMLKYFASLRISKVLTTFHFCMCLLSSCIYENDISIVSRTISTLPGLFSREERDIYMFHSSFIFHLFHPRGSNCVLVEFLPWKAIVWCKRPNLRKRRSIKGLCSPKGQLDVFSVQYHRGSETAFSS